MRPRTCHQRRSQSGAPAQSRRLLPSAACELLDFSLFQTRLPFSSILVSRPHPPLTLCNTTNIFTDLERKPTLTNVGICVAFPGMPPHLITPRSSSANISQHCTARRKRRIDLLRGLFSRNFCWPPLIACDEVYFFISRGLHCSRLEKNQLDHMLRAASFTCLECSVTYQLSPKEQLFLPYCTPLLLPVRQAWLSPSLRYIAHAASGLAEEERPIALSRSDKHVLADWFRMINGLIMTTMKETCGGRKAPTIIL